MKKLLLVLALAVMAVGAMADTWVNGYTKRDGTHVQGHHRSSPDQYRYNNYSSQGNTNPYTGQRGTQRNEFSNPPAYNKSYGAPRYQGGNSGLRSSNCYGLSCR